MYEHTVIVSLVWMHSCRRIEDLCLCGPEASTSSHPVASQQPASITLSDNEHSMLSDGKTLSTPSICDINPQPASIQL